MKIKGIFLDIGGVILSDGWDHHARKRAARHFRLDYAEMEIRHKFNVSTYELGKITLNEYLARIVFYKKRPFSKIQFFTFMKQQTRPYPEMINLMRQIKLQHRLKIIVVSNEGRDLNLYRIKKFGLETFVDFFVSSCFVHFRKPDTDIYRFALDLALLKANQVLYLEDQSMFVRVAESLGIKSIQHEDFVSTRFKLAKFGLSIATQ